MSSTLFRHPLRTPARRTHRVRATLLICGLAVGMSSTIGVGIADATPSAPVKHSRVAPTGGLSIPGVRPAATASPNPKVPGEASPVEVQLFTALNQQRAANGLGALTWSNQLNLSSLKHNQSMAAVNTLSHQLPGEAGLGDRITATGYRWRAAAENIGWNSRANDDGAVALQWMFYNETPPNDGHRRNILSTSTSQVGISVYYDGKGKVWVTEDFGQPR